MPQDKGQKGQDQEQEGQEQEGQEGQHEDLVQGLENHENGPDTEPQQGAGTAESKDASAEHGAGGKPQGEHEGKEKQTEQPSNAVDAIDKKVSKARTKMWKRGEKRRLKEQEARIKAREGGKDWNAQTLADLLKNGGAQEVLRQIGQRKPLEAINIMKTAGTFDKWITALGEGKLMVMASKQLDLMVQDKVIDDGDLAKWFKVRFAVDLRDGSAPWVPDVARRVWYQMSILPPKDCTKNTAIALMTSNGDQGGGTYNSGSKKIDLGQDIQGDEENLDNTVRHEVGHGVHSQLRGTVDSWLKNDVGFTRMGSFKEFVDDLAAEGGGFPSHYTAGDGTQKPFLDQYKTDMVTLIEQYTGQSKWGPAKATVWEGQDPEYQFIYKALPQKLQAGVAQSKTNWFTNYANFAQAGGNRMFLNHWYHVPMKMSGKATQTITATNDTYAAMSPDEFFATSYSEYFRDPTGVKKPENWGGNLSGSVKAFFKECIVQRQPYDKFQKSQRIKHT